jgi:anti-anti-sigma factor
VEPRLTAPFPGGSEVPEASDRPLVEVELTSGVIAIATLRGAHDLNRAAEIANALERACDKPNVVADLSECAFIDSTVLARLASGHRKQAERGGRLELVLPSDSAHVVSRIVKLSRLDALFVIHETRGDALASMPLEESP